MSGPLDLTEVEHDNAILTALGRGELPLGAGAKDPLVQLLHAWREDIVNDLPTEQVHVPRISRRLGVAAAIIVIGFGSLGGLAAAASSATPGSTLWPVAEIIYGDKVASLEARENAKNLLAQAEIEYQQGQADLARQHVSKAMELVKEVQPTDGAADLQNKAREINKKLQSASPSTTAGQLTTPASTPRATTRIAPSPSHGGTQTTPPVTTPPVTTPPVTTPPVTDPPTTSAPSEAQNLVTDSNLVLPAAQ